ncbi:MAG TPA: hypothetical protein VFJ64_12455 [Solirubrobacterales bacterium]|nr:hypothetical protein [Solirubrobacterales bacterium]
MTSAGQQLLKRRTKVEIGADKDCRGRCVLVPPAALVGIKLPKRILLKGTKGRRVVAARRVNGAADAWILRADRELCDQLGPSSGPRNSVNVEASPAGPLAILRDGGLKFILNFLAALLAFLAACAGALATFLASELPTVAPITFALFCVGATIAFGRAVHNALKIEC